MREAGLARHRRPDGQHLRRARRAARPAAGDDGLARGLGADRRSSTTASSASSARSRRSGSSNDHRRPHAPPRHAGDLHQRGGRSLSAGDDRQRGHGRQDRRSRTPTTRGTRTASAWSTSSERIGYLGAEPCVPRPIRAYLELHIEQGPFLEEEGLSVGVVEGIVAIAWSRLTIHGVQDHAGPTPMRIRHDALVAGRRGDRRRARHRARDRRRPGDHGRQLDRDAEHPQRHPGPRDALDRHAGPAVTRRSTGRAAMLDRVVREACEREGVRYELEHYWRVPATPFAPRRRRRRRARGPRRRRRLPPHPLRRRPRRPVHGGDRPDRHGLRAVAGGRSHCEEEFTPIDDIEHGANHAAPRGAATSPAAREGVSPAAGLLRRRKGVAGHVGRHPRRPMGGHAAGARRTGRWSEATAGEAASVHAGTPRLRARRPSRSGRARKSGNIAGACGAPAHRRSENSRRRPARHRPAVPLVEVPDQHTRPGQAVGVADERPSKCELLAARSRSASPKWQLKMCNGVPVTSRSTRRQPRGSRTPTLRVAPTGAQHAQAREDGVAVRASAVASASRPSRSPTWRAARPR